MLTLKQAAALAADEYDAEIAAWNPAQKLAAQQVAKAEMDDLTDTVGNILASFVGLPISPSMFAMVCVRFGMRIQRKIDNPEETTTAYCGASTESDGVPN